MPEAVQHVVTQLRTIWAGLAWAQRGALLGVAGLSVAVLAWLTLSGNRPDLVTLYTNLTPTDAGQIVEQLKSNRVSYRVEDGGTRILVPASVVHETRIKLATAGLPQGGGVGFELFDRTSFGATDFVQKLNYQRALQGELARSISQLREVQQARVHIVLPQPSVFSDRERPTTASVVLTLRPGSRLAPEQVRGIVHLVSSSVEALEADRVTVIDTAGRMLSQPGERAGAGQHMERQANLELELQRRVQTMLEEVLGPGKVSVRVAAQVEFSHGERTEERVDPNTVVRSEQRSSETTKGSSTRPGGVVGSAANTGTPNVGASGSSNSNETVKEQESVQYEVGRIVERRTLVAGEIKRLSVAVLVDPPYKVTPGPGGTERKTPVPRDKAEMEKLRAMVMRAVGFSATRGDEVEVAELAFDTSAVERERVAAERVERQTFWWGAAQQAAWVGGLLLLAFLGLRVVKGLLVRKPGLVGTRLDVTEAAVAATAAAAQLSGKPAKALNPVDLVKVREREALQGRIADLARDNPEQVAQLVRSWMVGKRSS